MLGGTLAHFLHNPTGTIIPTLSSCGNKAAGISQVSVFYYRSNPFAWVLSAPLGRNPTNHRWLLKRPVKDRKSRWSGWRQKSWFSEEPFSWFLYLNRLLGNSKNTGTGFGHSQSEVACLLLPRATWGPRTGKFVHWGDSQPFGLLVHCLDILDFFFKLQKRKNSCLNIGGSHNGMLRFKREVTF